MKPFIFDTDYNAVHVAVVLETSIVFPDIVGHFGCIYIAKIAYYIVGESHIRQKFTTVSFTSVLKLVETKISILWRTAQL